jgi:hypothetical protein
MGLKIDENCYKHNLLFADDQVVIDRGTEDANYKGINWTSTRTRLKTNYETRNV